jgi:hypothetical protein
MGRRGAVAVGVVAGVAVGVGVLASAVSAAAPPACAGRDLTGTFAAVRGSAGAGQISYNLRLRNRSAGTCFVSGLPVLRLLDRAGKPLPTHIAPSHPGALTAVRVVLRPGGYSAATARFSPDVPGTGEQVVGPCERKAFHARVNAPPGGGVVVVPLVPATPVCEHGGMVLSVLVYGKRGPATA